MSGSLLRTGQLFRPRSGRSFITAFDHGTNLVVGPEFGSPLKVLTKIVEGEPDGVLLSAGMLKAGAELFAHRGAPVPIVRADWTVINDDWKADVGDQYEVLLSPSDAAEMGAGAICMYLIMGPDSGKTFAANVRSLSRAAAEASRIGLPLIIEATLWGSRHRGNTKDPQLLQHAIRMAYEIGADAIKTEFVDDVDTMRAIITSVEVPVLTLGGAKGETAEVIRAARGAIRAGARGLIFGRNVWNTPDPVAITRELSNVVHETA